MPFYIELDGNKIKNLFHSDVFTPEAAVMQVTDITGETLRCCSNFDAYRWESGALVPVTLPEASPRATTPLQFMDRFTESEQLAIVTATMAVPQVKLWYDRMIAATEIVYKDPRTIGGLQALVTAGLITQSRMDEILPEAWR